MCAGDTSIETTLPAHTKLALPSVVRELTPEAESRADTAAVPTPTHVATPDELTAIAAGLLEVHWNEPWNLKLPGSFANVTCVVSASC